MLQHVTVGHNFFGGENAPPLASKGLTADVDEGMPTPRRGNAVRTVSVHGYIVVLDALQSYSFFVLRERCFFISDMWGGNASYVT